MKVVFNIGSIDEYVQAKIDKLREKYKHIDIKINEKDYSDIDILVAYKMTSDELAKANALKVLFVPYTGLNRFPEEELQKKGIKIFNTHNKSQIVAERALALTLAVMGRVVEFHNEMKQGSWAGVNKNKEWHSLYKKKAGILGMGHIGTHIAKLLQPFKCEISALERGKGNKMVTTYVNTLEELVDHVDILYIAIPLTEESKHLIDGKIISRMKDKFIINIARGHIIEEKALYEALKNHQLAGAGLDVWYQYPKKDKSIVKPSKYPFHTLENVVMSPHAATFSIENKYDYMDDIFDSIDQYMEMIQ